MRPAIILAVLLLAACSEVGPYYCGGNDECIVDDVQGVCVTAYEACAFPDPTCPGPQYLRYDESAGDLADVCVGEEQ